MKLYFKIIFTITIIIFTIILNYDIILNLYYGANKLTVENNTSNKMKIVFTDEYGKDKIIYPSYTHYSTPRTYLKIGFSVYLNGKYIKQFGLIKTNRNEINSYYFKVKECENDSIQIFFKVSGISNKEFYHKFKLAEIPD